MADVSIRSTQSNISRGARPESGRLHRKFPYRWLFDQVHVKSLIFNVEVCMLAGALVGLYTASQMSSEQNFEPLPIPGFDGLPAFGETARQHNGVLNRPNYRAARNLINLFSYFLIFSSVTGFLGMRLSETSITKRNFPSRINPACLLIPSSISVAFLMYPLFMWSLRTVHSTIRLLINEKMRIPVILDSFRLSVLPVVLVWAVYIYFLYGFWLGVLYYQRRGDPPTPTTHDSPFRRPLRKSLIRFQGKGGVSLLADIVNNDEASNCVFPISTTIPNTSISTLTSSSSSPSTNSHSNPPRIATFRHLETVDEEAQSRTSTD